MDAKTRVYLSLHYKNLDLLFSSMILIKDKGWCLQVFSAFGFVHKITTFEKTAGFQVGVGGCVWCVLVLCRIFSSSFLFPFWLLPALTTLAHFMYDLVCRL